MLSEVKGKMLGSKVKVLTTMGDVEEMQQSVVLHRSVIKDVSRLGAVVHGGVESVVEEA